MFLVSFVVLLGLVSSVSAIVVDDTQTWTGKLSINGGTLEIGPNGNLTIPDNERHELINGAHLILNGGTMTVHGQRLRCETGSTITLNSGYLRVNTADGLKFPDDPPGPCTMYLYGGTLSTTWVQPFAERGSRFIVGGGTLQVDTTPLENTEPQEWVNQGMITLAPGYIEIVATSNSLSAIIKPSSYPYDRAENVPIDVELSWEGAEAAVSFDVYFGTDPNDVNDANTTVTLGAYQGNQEPNGFNPGGLQLNETYYWRIDEVNDASIIHKGDVWSFTTITRLGLEDCESYADTNALTAVWAGAGGASIELSTEQHHQGEKSLQLGYDNSPGNQYSEIGLTFDDALDWASSGASALGLYFKGLPTNDSDRMYFVLEDATGGSATVTYNGNMNDLKKENWQPLGIILRQFTGVDLSAVKKFIIGIGDRGSSPSGGSGTVYFDDIALCMSICIPENGPVADFDGDCMVNSKDFAIMARDWLESGAFETDLYEDCKVDLKDCAVLADSWLIEQLSLVGESPSTYQPGLAWVMFHSSNFTRPGDVGVDSQIDIDTGTSINDYSNIWVGSLKVPTNGEVTIEAEADNGLRLWIRDEQVIKGWYLDGEREGTFTGEKGELLPVRLEYFQNGGEGFLRLYWSWACQGRELIPAWALWHTDSDAKWVQEVYEGQIPVTVYENKSSIYAPRSELRKPMPVRPGPHLFIGDYLIESSENVTREVQQPQRDPNIPNPVVTGPEDKNFQAYLTVLHYPDCNPNCFRIWYNARTADFNMSRSHIGYLESADGINWIRPAQVLDPFTIQFGCSVIDMGSGYPNPAERYKFGYYYGGGLRVGVSPDGLSWVPLVPGTVLYHNHDINGIFWDSLRDCYVATVSTSITGEKWSGSRRVTMQSFGDDLINWMIPWYVLTPDDSSDEGETQFYAMDGYLVRGPLKIGMVKVLRDDLVAEPPVHPSSYGIGYTTLAWTLDGEHWTRDQEIFFDRDHETDPIPWDHAHAWIDEQVIVGDEVYLYYGGYKQGHKVNRFEERQIGLVKMPLDRYVARQAQDQTPGTLLTVPLLMDTQPGCLVVNADASVGQLRVQVRDAGSNAVMDGLSFGDCTPITTDGLHVEVHWGTAEQTGQKLANLANEAIKLEFELTNAKLFAFEFVSP